MTYRDHRVGRFVLAVFIIALVIVAIAGLRKNASLPMGDILVNTPEEQSRLNGEL